VVLNGLFTLMERIPYFDRYRIRWVKLAGVIGAVVAVDAFVAVDLHKVVVVVVVEHVAAFLVFVIAPSDSPHSKYICEVDSAFEHLSIAVSTLRK
jgi:hypothetical protein